jgi:pimeloyl-ACP methyl ester carboxylesterase
VIAPDLPGHGASEVTDGPLDAARTLAWLGELIERSCPTPPVVVGQVIGGAIAARFAAVRGDRLGRLVLVDALGLAPFQPAPEFERALMDFITYPGEVTYDGLWSRCAFDLDHLRQRMGEVWDLLKAYNLDRARTPSVVEAQHALLGEFGMTAIPEAELARIGVPTTLIWGRHDLATPLAVAEAARTRHGWSLQVIEDAGDDPAIEQPHAFLKALRSALGEPG